MARSWDMARLVAARFISRAGGEAAFFVGLWGKAAYQFDATAGQLALLMAANAIAMMVGSTAGGLLVDRYGPRKVLIGFEIAFVPAAISLTFARSIPELIGLAALTALCAAPVLTATSSFAPYLVEDAADLERANALIAGAGSAAFVAGAAGGALIASYLSVDWVFYLDAATSVLGAALVWGIRLRVAPRGRIEGSTTLSEFKEGLKVAFGLRPLRYYVLMGTLVWLGFGAFGALEPIYFRDVLGQQVSAIGWVNSLFGIGLIIGAALLPRLPAGVLSARGLAWFSALSGLGAVLYVSWGDVRLAAAGGFVWAVVIGVVEPQMRTLMHRDTPHEAVGRVMGTSETLRTFGELAPLAAAPALAAVIGVQATLIAGGLVTTVIALASLFEAGTVDRMTSGAVMARIAPAAPSGEPLSPNP